MDSLAWINLAVFMAVLLMAAWPTAKWLSAVAEGRLPRWMHAVEKPLYQLAGVKSDEGMHWKRYALALLLFNFIGVLVVYGSTA